ncbi:hypothetical protein BDQ12DRAFT_641238 [Crucibulum laeve]|uniref:Uncharacterized protein n=1 Tax=Crucibulum laeve TaxID=68775 RepID=A0A5C3MGG5_9AGAR|nr:hypothetical protein BDQ12DRAFT_641238 [Crucibulum laeve]
MMNVLKTPSFFRPASRPTSPAPAPSRPDPTQPFDRSSRPLNKLSLSNFRRPSPSPYPSTTPALPLVQDGSYLEMLGLKLSEAVSRALAQPTGPAAVNEQVGGRRPIPQGRGHALGALIASELKATNDNPHLHRAIIRSLHRPLSVLLTNLSAHLLPLLNSPAFHTPPAPTVQSPNPNPTQLHALAIAGFSEELLESFDELGLGVDSDARGDGLKSIREGLASLINRVVTPLVTALRGELMPLIEALETPNTSAGVKVVIGAKVTVVNHPSIVTLQTLMPICARALTRYTSSPLSHATLATFLISLVWKGLVALSHRQQLTPSPPPSPQFGPSLPVKKRTGSSSTTPPITPPAGRFTIKLPPSRPPSPPLVSLPASAAADARALYELLNTLPRPGGGSEASRLAREAVDEAFEGLKALPILLDAIQNKSDSGHNAEELASEMDVLTTELPSLIVLPILLHAYGDGVNTSVPSLLGLKDEEYRKGCLSGFGRAEECATAVVHRVMTALLAKPDGNGIVLRWLELEIAEIGSAVY